MVCSGGGGILTVGCGLALWSIPAGRGWKHASYDSIFRFSYPEVTNKLTLVFMDEEAFKATGQVCGQPWDRGTNAAFLERLTDDGCPLVVFDVFFEAARHPESDRALASALRRHGRTVLARRQVNADNTKQIYRFFEATAGAAPTDLSPYAFTTIAGSAGDANLANGLGEDARFNSPSAIALDIAGNAYIADDRNHTIRVIHPDSRVSTLAGNGTPGIENGSVVTPRFRRPKGVAVDNAGNVYVADTENHIIRKITGGMVCTLAAGSEDGTWATARFTSPSGIAIDMAGVLWVADARNHTVRHGSPTANNDSFAFAIQLNEYPAVVEVDSFYATREQGEPYNIRRVRRPFCVVANCRTD